MVDLYLTLNTNPIPSSNLDPDPEWYCVERVVPLALVTPNLDSLGIRSECSRMYKLGRPRGHDFTNIAVPRWVFGFWTWNLDTWFSSSSPRHPIVDTFLFFFSAHIWPAEWFPWSSNWETVHQNVFVFCVSIFACLDEPELNHVSKVQFRTLKIERGTAILVKSWPLGRPSLHML